MTQYQLNPAHMVAMAKMERHAFVVNLTESHVDAVAFQPVLGSIILCQVFLRLKLKHVLEILARRETATASDVGSMIGILRVHSSACVGPEVFSV